MSMLKLYNEIKRQVNHEYHNWLATEDEHMAHDIWIRYKAKQDIAQQISDILMEEAKNDDSETLTLEEIEAIIYTLCSEYKIACNRYKLAVEQKADKDQTEYANHQRVMLLIGLRNSIRKLDDHMFETLKKGGL